MGDAREHAASLRYSSASFPRSLDGDGLASACPSAATSAQAAIRGPIHHDAPRRGISAWISLSSTAGSRSVVAVLRVALWTRHRSAR
ncbi:hypothetical protein BE08_07690 [Sorangium cellulosum]|uniref:Uncharacterized protein n=1 Tax=Sorangium cellulosum TaxID=56 RepID=A0A150PJT3_SORCE|nr:hypothetical protein BE08_07690 [Sorangium cellulosum]